MSRGAMAPTHPDGERRAVRTLARAGCDPETLRTIVAHLHDAAPSGADAAERLADVAGFAVAIGPRAAHDFFRAVRETKAIRPLLDPQVLAFARAVDPHTAEWYFWALWGTHAVRELTDPALLADVGFFRSLDSAATVEYFLAIRETRAAETLTSARVRALATSVGPEAATEFFGAFWETGAIGPLADAQLFDRVRALGREAAKEYFLALRATRAVTALTRPELLEFASTTGRPYAAEMFRAIRATGAAEALTNEAVRLFAELIGRDAAEEYFRILTCTRAVGPLTRPAVLRASAVVRAIGRDAARDYFLAAAEPSEGASSASDREADSAPVRTLLELPSYGRWRAAALVGATGVFWGTAGPWTALRGGADPVGLLLLVAAWVALVSGTFALSGMVASRSGELFLERRRRLLNEHGIRWHDCRTTDRSCPVCWAAPGHHADGQFDCEPFCRCPVC